MRRNKILILVSALVAIALVVGAVFFFGFYLPEKQKEAEWERLVHEYYQNKLSLYQAENEAYADYEVDVAFLGDSLTDGYALEQYYPNYITANRGIGGETTHGLEQRLQVSVYDLKPKIVVLLIGGNNLDTMTQNYERILIGLRDHLPDTKVVLVSLSAMGGDWAHKNPSACYHNVMIKKLAEKYSFAFVDLYTPLFDEASGEIYARYTTDGVHFTAEGYEVFTNALTPTLESLLNEK